MPVYRIAPAVFWGAGFSAFFCACTAAALCLRFGGRPVRPLRMLFILLLGGYLLLIPALALFPVRFDPKVGVLRLPWRNGIFAAVSPAAAAGALPGARRMRQLLTVHLRGALLLLPLGFLLPASGKRLHGILPCLGVILLYEGAVGAARLAEYSAGLVPYGCSAEEWLAGIAGAGLGFVFWRWAHRLQALKPKRTGN